MADETQIDGTPREPVVWVAPDEDRTHQPVADGTSPTEPSTVPELISKPNSGPSATPSATPSPRPSIAPGIAPGPDASLAIDPTIGVAAKDQSKVLAQTVISTFTDRLKIEAEKRGGYLTVGDIEQLSREFDRKREALETVFQQSFEQYVSIRERAAFDHARKFPFDRIIVNTFASLFDKNREIEDGSRAVTRHVLPGFFLALDKMIGPETMEGYQARCRVIVHRMSKGKEIELDWGKIYDDPEAQKVCFDALVTFAPYFEDIKKRQEWFLPIANNNLAAGHDWELTEDGFQNLIEEMFSKLRDQLADPDGRKKLEEQYSGLTCFELDRIFEKMS